MDIYKSSSLVAVQGVRVVLLLFRLIYMMEEQVGLTLLLVVKLTGCFLSFETKTQSSVHNVERQHAKASEDFGLEEPVFCSVGVDSGSAPGPKQVFSSAL